MALPGNLKETPVKLVNNGVIKILGQTGDASTETILYTCPANMRTEVVSIFACNRSGAGARTIDIGVSDGGGALAAADYLYNTLSVATNDTFLISTPIFLEASDELRVVASTSDVSFSAFGKEFLDI